MKEILLVEDDQILSEMYQDKFSKEGYSIKIASTGEDGLKQALTSHPDLILLDIALPQMDGLAVIERLRKDEWGTTVPIIFLTNLNPDGKILQTIVKDYPAYCLTKSNTTPADVVKKVAELLQEKETKSQKSSV